MSRYYEMHVVAKGIAEEKYEEIQEAIDSEWSISDWLTDGSEGAEPDRVEGIGRSNLYGGESEKEFVERMSLAVWKANGSYCSVTVSATCLEDIPSYSYEFSESDYENMIADQHRSGAKPAWVRQRTAPRVTPRRRTACGTFTLGT